MLGESRDAQRAPAHGGAPAANIVVRQVRMMPSESFDTFTTRRFLGVARVHPTLKIVEHVSMKVGERRARAAPRSKRANAGLPAASCRSEKASTHRASTS